MTTSSIWKGWQALARKGKREIIDFAARMMAFATMSLGAMGHDAGIIATSLAVQAKASGIDHQDFEQVCRLALKHGHEFERATFGEETNERIDAV